MASSLSYQAPSSGILQISCRTARCHYSSASQDVLLEPSWSLVPLPLPFFSWAVCSKPPLGLVCGFLAWLQLQRMWKRIGWVQLWESQCHFSMQVWLPVQWCQAYCWRMWVTGWHGLYPWWSWWWSWPHVAWWLSFQSNPTQNLHRKRQSLPTSFLH